MRRFEQQEPVRFEDVTVVAETEKAICCDIDSINVWIPQSQVHEDSEVWREGDEGTLVISRWIYDKLREEGRL